MNLEDSTKRHTLRVLHVMASVSPVRGGTSTAIWILLDALRRQGIAADLATTDDDGPGRRMSVPLHEFSVHDGFNVRYFPRQSDFYNASAPMVGWLLKEARSYDLVHVHGLFSFGPIVAAQIARWKTVPYVVSPHGMLERWARDNARPRLKRSSIRLVEGPILRGAAAVHFTSAGEFEQAKELGIPINGEVIPLGLPDIEVTNAQVARRDDNTLLFLSRIDVKKGLDLLIAAFATVRTSRPELRLIIAGEGPEALVGELKALARKLRVDDSIQWAGFVQGEAKKRLFDTATAFILPSRSENFGYAAVEAMAAGLPVVVSRAVGVSDLVGRYGAGRVTDVSIASVASEVAAILSDVDRDSMAAAGRRAVAAELSVETYGVRMSALYRAILARACGQRMRGESLQPN